MDKEMVEKLNGFLSAHSKELQIAEKILVDYYHTRGVYEGWWADDDNNSREEVLEFLSTGVVPWTEESRSMRLVLVLEVGRVTGRIEECKDGVWTTTVEILDNSPVIEKPLQAAAAIENAAENPQATTFDF